MTLAVRMMWIAGMAAVPTVFACSEQVEARYASYADAVHEGAVHRGWIPTYVPPSATEIVEVHNLDTNAQLLRFQAPPEALKAMTSRLTGVPSEKVPAPPSYLSLPKGGLWRRGLGSGTLPQGMSVYRAHLESGGVHCVAIDTQHFVAYAWTWRD
ncbi:MAG TPA: hypothetical protein VLC54_17860 [Anaeromyxobacter sp.]|nr:hypothetical protein [Anaeromyxobacter sp.]